MNPLELGVLREQLRERIDLLLSMLTFREREILKLRFGIGDGDECSLEEVGRIFRITRERARQIEARAFRRLSFAANRQRLASFVDDCQPFIEPDLRDDPAIRRLTFVGPEQIGVGPKDRDYYNDPVLAAAYLRRKRGASQRSTSKHIRRAQAAIQANS